MNESALLFDRKGYHSTTMSDIAAAVGVRKPTLYHYFKSKEEILFWVHEEFVDVLLSRYRARAKTQMTPSHELLEFMADMLGVIHSHRGHVRVFFEHYRELSEQQQATINKEREAYQQLVEAVILRGVEAGEFAPVDARLAALALFGMVNWAYQWYRPSGALSSREIAYAFWDLYLRGALNRDRRELEKPTRLAADLH